MKSKTIWQYIIFIAILFSCIYIMNKYTPMMTDDFSYSFSWTTGKRIHNIKDVMCSMRTHYYKWGGRLITLGLSQIFLIGDKSVFNIVNTFVIGLLILLITYHGQGSMRKISIQKLFWCFAMIFLLTPAFGQSYLWIVGSSIYLYGLVLLLIFLLPYNDILNQKKKFIWKIILIPTQLVLGFLVGDTVENFSVAAVTIMICLLIYSIVYNKSELGYVLSGFIGSVAGSLFLLRAPGTYIRLNQTGHVSVIGIIKNFIFVSMDIFQKFGILLGGIVIALFIVYEQRKKENEKFGVQVFLKEYKREIIFLWGFMASTYSMIVSPERPDRIWSASLAFLIIVLFNCINKIKVKDLCYVKKLMLLCNGIIGIIIISVWMNAYFGLKNTYYENVNREYQISKAKKEHTKEIELPAIKGYSKYSCFSEEGDLKYDSGQWPNTTIAKYYGIKKIIRIDEDK